MPASAPCVTDRAVKPLIGLAGGTLIWLALVGAGFHTAHATLAGLSIVGALAFIIGALGSLGRVSAGAMRLVDAAAGGAMLVAAWIIVVPHAITAHPVSGLIGIGAGLLIGALLHFGAFRTIDQMALTGLTLHAFSGGIALGALYTLQPTIGWTAGLAILAHKTPAGYLLSRRLAQAGRCRLLIGWPALATGLGALPVAMMRAIMPIPGGLMFGIAAGMFIYVALGFIGEIAPRFRENQAIWLAGLIGGTTIALAWWMMSVVG